MKNEQGTQDQNKLDRMRQEARLLKAKGQEHQLKDKLIEAQNYTQERDRKIVEAIEKLDL